jgi:hypothetical protein
MIFIAPESLLTVRFQVGFQTRCLACMTAKMRRLAASTSLIALRPIAGAPPLMLSEPLGE